MTFKEAKKALSKMAKGEYHTISYQITESRPGEIEEECAVYIHGKDRFVGETWEEVIEKMSDACFPDQAPDEEVAV